MVDKSSPNPASSSGVALICKEARWGERDKGVVEGELDVLPSLTFPPPLLPRSPPPEVDRSLALTSKTSFVGPSYIFKRVATIFLSPSPLAMMTRSSFSGGAISLIISLTKGSKCRFMVEGRMWLRGWRGARRDRKACKSSRGRGEREGVWEEEKKGRRNRSSLPPPSVSLPRSG